MSMDDKTSPLYGKVQMHYIYEIGLPDATGQPAWVKANIDLLPNAFFDDLCPPPRQQA